MLRPGVLRRKWVPRVWGSELRVKAQSYPDRRPYRGPGTRCVVAPVSGGGSGRVRAVRASQVRFGAVPLSVRKGVPSGCTHGASRLFGAQQAWEAQWSPHISERGRRYRPSAKAIARGLRIASRQGERNRRYEYSGIHMVAERPHATGSGSICLQFTTAWRAIGVRTKSS